jgi:hypothetical protein
MTDEAKQQTEPQWAPGLDEVWHAHTDSSTDAADAEKRAIEAQDFQQARALRYLESGGMDDTGGYVLPTLTRSRMINWLQMPRGMNWM